MMKMMMTYRVHSKWNNFDIYIGRALGIKGLYGNPFPISQTTTRDQSVLNHKKWLLGTAFKTFKQQRRRAVLLSIGNLKGKILGCFCNDYQKCHGDFLIELAEGDKYEIKKESKEICVKKRTSRSPKKRNRKDK